MGIGNVMLKAAKVMFKKPYNTDKKIYELPFFVSTAFAGTNAALAVSNAYKGNNDKLMGNTMNTYAGMGAMVGSVFGGAGGAILVGGGVKLLCELTKPDMMA